MSSKTTNFNLHKIDLTDAPPDITVLNQNWDKIDTELKEAETHISNTSNPHNVTKAQVGLGNVDNTSDANKPISTATQTALDNKVDKVSGKGLSTNDYTTDEKNKLAGIATGANAYTLPVATPTTLGGVKSGTDITVDSNGNVSVNDSSHNHAATNITSGTLSSDRLPTVPITKGGTGATTAAAALTNLGLTATAAELNKMDGVTATTAELNYVDGVTSNIQTQLNAKAASSTVTSHTGNKANPHGVTAAQTGALPTAGGTMAGTIEFKKVENGYGRLAKNHGSTADYGMYLTDIDIDGKTVKLILSGKDNNIYFVGNDNSAQNRLFGEHNKQLMRDNIFEAGTTDLTAGSSAMTTGKLYFVYE